MANTTDIRFFHAVVTDDLASVRTTGKVAESTLYAAARETIVNDNPAILAELLQRGLIVDYELLLFAAFHADATLQLLLPAMRALQSMTERESTIAYNAIDILGIPTIHYKKASFPASAASYAITRQMAYILHLRNRPDLLAFLPAMDIVYALTVSSMTAHDLFSGYRAPNADLLASFLDGRVQQTSSVCKFVVRHFGKKIIHNKKATKAEGYNLATFWLRVSHIDGIQLGLSPMLRAVTRHMPVDERWPVLSAWQTWYRSQPLPVPKFRPPLPIPPAMPMTPFTQFQELPVELRSLIVLEASLPRATAHSVTALVTDRQREQLLSSIDPTWQEHLADFLYDRVVDNDLVAVDSLLT